MTTQIRILFLDIESSDLHADIGHVICIGYKWAHEKSPHIMSLIHHPGRKSNDDSKLLEAFRPIISKADLVVYHFGQFFDYPFLQTRLLIHGLKPYPVVQGFDTWRTAKYKMRFKSNRLERILEVLGCPYEKSPVKLSVWGDARIGDPKAVKYVVDHCKRDVLIEEWVYNKISCLEYNRPSAFIRKHWSECANCGRHTMRSEGLRTTATRTYRRLNCSNCGFTAKGEVIK